MRGIISVSFLLLCTTLSIQGLEYEEHGQLQGRRMDKEKRHILVDDEELDQISNQLQLEDKQIRCGRLLEKVEDLKLLYQSMMEHFTVSKFYQVIMLLRNIFKEEVPVMDAEIGTKFLRKRAYQGFSSGWISSRKPGVYQPVKTGYGNSFYYGKRNTPLSFARL